MGLRAGRYSGRENFHGRASTRKVVYQTQRRKRYFQQFGCLVWAIKIRMLEALQSAHLDAVAQGRVPTSSIGVKSKPMATLRAVGRSMMSVHVLVFNMGKSDFREKAFGNICPASADFP